jgi:hypothetical protein
MSTKSQKINNVTLAVEEEGRSVASLDQLPLGALEHVQTYQKV